MAVAPLFIESMAILKGQLRLSGAAETDSLAILNSAVLKARVRLYKALSGARVAEILSTAHTDAPDTDAQITRINAENVELACVKSDLLRTMPTLFMDGSANKREIWNEEQIARRGGPSDVAAELERLEAEIDKGLEELIGDSEEAAGEVRATCIGPLTTPPVPGASVWDAANEIHCAHGDVHGGCF